MLFWPLTSCIDFPTDQTHHQLYDLYTDLDFHRIYEWFLWSIFNGCGMPAGSANPSGHLVRPPYLDLLMLQLLIPDCKNLPCLYSTFHLEYPSVLSRFALNASLSDITFKQCDIAHLF